MSRLLALQEAARTRLAEDPAFAGVPVLSRSEGDIANDIQAAVDRLGICAYVFPPLPRRANANLPGPVFDAVELRVKVIENPVLNGTGKKAHALLEAALGSLHHWRDPVSEALFYCEGDCVSAEDEAAETIFDAVFTTAAEFSTAPEETPEPTPEP